MFNHIDEEFMFSKYEILFALLILLILGVATWFTQGITKFISLSLLTGYAVYLLDFYLKDLIEEME